MSDAFTARRSFLRRGLAVAGALVLGGPELRVWRSIASPLDSSLPEKGTTGVLEAHFLELRDESGAAKRPVVEDSVLGLVQVLMGDFPLDGLSTLFPDGPPIAVLVDARNGRAESTTIMATHLAAALKEAGSPGDSVLVSEVSDADLIAGGYRIVRDGEGPRCHGAEPGSGYGAPRDLPAVGMKIRAAKILDDPHCRLAVLARLFAREGRMGPFVLDAALRVFAGPTRKKAQTDPQFAAKLLASPFVGGRVNLVIGELFELALGPSGGAGAPVGASAGRNDGKGSTPMSPAGKDVWHADTVLAGRNLFAVERIGYTILANTMKARGLAAPDVPPILAAADTLGFTGARLSSLAWKKAIL